MDDEKAVKHVKQFAVVYLIFVVIVLVANLMQGAKFGSIISYIMAAILLVVSYIGANNRAMYGPICGIIVAILMIISFSVIDMILGVFFLINCINLIKALK